MLRLNPGQMVRITEGEHAALGLGHMVANAGGKAKVEFRPSPFFGPPFKTETAVFPHNSVEVVAGPVERLAARDFDEPRKFELKQRAAHLIVANRNGLLSNLLVQLMPHQIDIARRVISSSKRRFLIAEEVGLGKTIEVGLIIHILAMRGAAKRVLIVAPAGLTPQWQEEMREKFHMDFSIYGSDATGTQAFEANDRLIAPLETLRLNRTRNRERAAGHRTTVAGSRHWDIIVFDEAHRLSAKIGKGKRVVKTHAFRLAEELRDRTAALLLLTGTPHRGYTDRFRFLVGLLDDNVVFHSGPKRKRDVPFTELILKNRKSRVTDAQGNRLFKDIEITALDVAWSDENERRFNSALEDYLREGYGFADRDRQHPRRKAIGLVMMTFQKLAASSTAAIKGALRRRAERIKGEEQVESERVSFVDDRFMGEMEERKALGSVDPFSERELEMIEGLLDMEVRQDAKLTELFTAIDGISKDEPNRKVLIFTEYRQTQDYLVEQLAHRYGEACTTIIRGGMPLQEKIDNAQIKFRQDEQVRFLVSTEAGGEGINLQFCHVMFNYDLPWNPFRLAQRYGRLYRYGQLNVVKVFNFAYRDSIEQRVRRHLEERTKAAAESLARITGESLIDIEYSVLGTLEEYLDYEKIYREAMKKGSLMATQDTIDRGIRRAEEAFTAGHEAVGNLGRSLNSARGEPFGAEELDLRHVQEFVVEFVNRFGERLHNQAGVFGFITPFELTPTRGLQRKYRGVTFDRDAAINSSELEFMALGHPLTDAAVRFAGGPEMGGFTATRQIMDYRFSGLSGLHFNFLVRKRTLLDDREEVRFDLVPVFVTWDGEPVEEAGRTALTTWGEPRIPEDRLEFHADRVGRLWEIAVKTLKDGYADEGLWEEDVECLNAAVTRFV